MGAKVRVLLLAAAVVCAGVGGIAIAQHGPTCMSDFGVNMPTANDAANYVVSHLSSPDELSECMNVSDPDVTAEVMRIIADQDTVTSLKKGLIDGSEYEFVFVDEKLKGFGVVVAGSNKRTLRAPSSQPYWRVDIYAFDSDQSG